MSPKIHMTKSFHNCKKYVISFKNSQKSEYKGYFKKRNTAYKLIGNKMQNQRSQIKMWNLNQHLASGNSLMISSIS